jgi:arylsulfatase A-like enzyme
MQPNIVVIQTDDQGRWAMPHRMPELVMPHLAALLAESLELEELYCASPVCSPARASILTGRMPSAHGIHDWLIGGRHPQAYPDRYLDGQPTTPEVLSRAGYQCFLSGKWHVGDSRTPAPGFYGWYAHRYGGGPYVDAPVWVDGVAAQEPRYFTHAVTEEAVRFVRERDRGRPFYLQVNYTAPHTPWLEGHPEDYTALYDGCEFPSVPREPQHPWTEWRREDFADSYADPVPSLVGYCAALSAVDRGVGSLRDLLAAEGLTESTIIVYLSDNGFACGHHGIWGKGNGTYPMNFWDTSVRVPGLVHVPGGPVGTSDALLSSASLHATLCDLAGVAADPDRWQAAGSFAPLFRGEPYEGVDVVVVASEYGGGRMITDGRWKYVARASGPEELYDRAADPDERTNLAEAEPDLCRAWAHRLQEWFAGRERAGASAYDHDVRGHGQIHPVWRGRSDAETYAVGTESWDGI